MNSKYVEEWIAAEKTEWDSLVKNGTFVVVDRPNGTNVVGCKWVYRIKLKADGSIERFKARLVAQGFTQQYGIDFKETYSPVIRGATFRWLLAMATLHNWDMRMLDVTTAYLNGLLEEDIYMEIPEGFGDNKNGTKVLKLVKGLYGLKQAGRVWYNTLSRHLRSLNYIQSRADPCIFFKKHQNGTKAFLAVYVDDICLFGDPSAIRTAIKDIQKGFDIRDLGSLTYCLGIQIDKSNTGTFVHQTKYIRDILKRFEGLYSTRRSNVPLPPVTLRPRRDNSDPSYDATLDAPADQQKYLEVIGSLNYASINTRPDLATAVSYLSSFSHNPSVVHWAALMKVLQYLNSTTSFGLFYSKTGNRELEGYADAAFNVHHGGRSQLGYLVTLAGAAVSWKSTKTTSVALSATEAEYMAISELGREIQAFVNIHAAIQLPLTGPVKVYEDNEGVLAMCVSDVYTNRSKHIDLRHHYIRSLVEHNIVDVAHIPGIHQPADLLTKPLSKNKFTKFRANLGLKDKV
jgi:hypothetical protein